MQKTGKMQTDNCIQLPKYVIIVAGGKGLRMGGEIPKQFRPISGHPVLMHTLEAFYRYDPEIETSWCYPKNSKIIGTTYVFNIDLPLNTESLQEDRPVFIQ